MKIERSERKWGETERKIDRQTDRERKQTKKQRERETEESVPSIHEDF